MFPLATNHLEYLFSTNIIFLRLVQDELDTYDDNTDLFVELPYLKKRSKIVEIVAAKDIIFAIA